MRCGPQRSISLLERVPGSSLRYCRSDWQQRVGAEECDLEHIEDSTWVLGSRDEMEGVDDFDGAGPRVVRLVAAFEGMRPEAWVAEVDPPIPDPWGKPQNRVLIFPKDEEGSLTQPRFGRHFEVGVGPLPGHAPDEPIGYAWYEGQLARNREDLPPTRAEFLAAYHAWLAASGDPNPGERVEFEGVPVGAFIGSVKSLRFDGALSPELTAHFESVPGWKWWEGDIIDLIAHFAQREGHCFVPRDYQAEDGRPLGWVARSYASAYRFGFFGLSERKRLEALPGWNEFVELANAEIDALISQLSEHLRQPRVQPTDQHPPERRDVPSHPTRRRDPG
jgi:hypothetical protein